MWVLVEGCSLTAYASSAPRCAATAGIVTLCACQAVMPNRSVLRAMRPESPAVISISRAAVLCARGKEDERRQLRSFGMGVKIGTLKAMLECKSFVCPTSGAAFSRDLEVRA